MIKINIIIKNLLNRKYIFLIINFLVVFQYFSNKIWNKMSAWFLGILMKGMFVVCCSFIAGAADSGQMRLALRNPVQVCNCSRWCLMTF